MLVTILVNLILYVSVEGALFRFDVLPHLRPLTEGKDLRLEEAPFLATIVDEADGLLVPHCVGAIVHHRFIVTTGSCCQKQKIRHSKIMFNTATLERGDTIGIESVMIHPDYDRNTNVNDLCLIRTAKSIRSHGSKKIKLLEPNEVNPGDALQIYSWGTNDENDGSGYQLKKAKIALLWKHSCTSSYDNFKFHESMLCAGGKKKGCHGGTGSPLVLEDKLIGLSSLGNACSKRPMIYTNIPYFKSWIEKNIRNQHFRYTRRRHHRTRHVPKHIFDGSGSREYVKTDRIITRKRNSKRCTNDICDDKGFNLDSRANFRGYVDDDSEELQDAYLDQELSVDDATPPTGDYSE